MKKIDRWTVETLKNGAGVYSCDNTVVRIAPDGARIVELFGNKIFYINARGVAFFTLAGWNTQTTRARLNALLYAEGVNVYTVRGCAYCRTVSTEQKPIESGAWYRVGVYADGNIVVVKTTRFD